MFGHHLPHVRARRDLEGADIAPAKIHAVVAQVGAAVEIITDNTTDPGTDGHFAFQLGVTNGRDPLIDVEVIGNYVFLAGRFILADFNRVHRLVDCGGNFTGSVLGTIEPEHAIDNRDV